MTRIALVGFLAAACFAPSSAAAATPPPKPPTKQECVTANESGQDLRRGGKLHDARSALATCMSTSCPRVVREDCAQRLADIEAAMPTIVFVAKDANSNDLSAVHVDMDGHRLLDHLDGEPVAIDPGEHHFAFQADGYRSIDTTVILREGDKKRRVMVFLDNVSSDTAPLAGGEPEGSPAQPAGAAPPAPPSAPAPAGASSGGNAQRIIGISLGVAGVAGLVVGGVFGVMAKLTADSADCKNDVCLSPQGETTNQNALSQAHVSDAAFATGGALLVGAAIIYFTAPTKASTTATGVARVVAFGPTWVEGGGGFGLRGTW